MTAALEGRFTRGSKVRRLRAQVFRPYCSLAGSGHPAVMDKSKIRRDFGRAVNMTAAELEAWLQTEESRKVGWKGRNGLARESVGHASGRRIVGILNKRATELSVEDYAHMRKVVGYVHRHGAQRPQNLYTSRWRYSLMNWGHDPAKEDER